MMPVSFPRLSVIGAQVARLTNATPGSPRMSRKFLFINLQPGSGEVREWPVGADFSPVRASPGPSFDGMVESSLFRITKRVRRPGAAARPE